MYLHLRQDVNELLTVTFSKEGEVARAGQSLPFQYLPTCINVWVIAGIIVQTGWLCLSGSVTFCLQALEALQCLPASPAKRSLEMMVDYVLDRLF